MYGTVLCIGGEKNNNQLYDYLHSKNLDISIVPDCNEAMSLITKVAHDVIIIDRDNIHDDLDRLKELKLHHLTAYIPIILISKNLHSDKKIKQEAVHCCIYDFMSVPIKYDELEIKLQNYLNIAEVRRNELAHNEEIKRELSIRTSHMKSAFVDVKHAYAEVIIKLSLAAEYKDPETGDHINRVAYYCRSIAEFMGMDTTFKDQIFYAAPMHDIGKIGIPDRVLLKPAALDKDEWSIMKSHSEIGHAILKEPKDSTLAMAQDIALYHHEKFDGSGYPLGLKSDKIPLSARIMAIADVYDALRSNRPYKKGLSHNDSYDIMINGDDRLTSEHFDPELLSVFKRVHKVFEEIYEGGYRNAG